MQKRTTERGATVVELLVYLFIFALLSAGSLTLLFSLDGLFAQYRAKQLLFTSGTALVERVLVEVREADTLNATASVVGSSTAASLVLESSGVTKQITWDGPNAAVTWQENGVYGGLLHSDAVAVAGMRTYHYVLNNIELVRLEIDLAATVGSYTETLTLSGGAIIRGSYVP